MTDLSLGDRLLEGGDADLVAEPRGLEESDHVVEVAQEEPLEEARHPDRVLAGDPGDLGERHGQIIAIALPRSAVQGLHRS